MTSFFVTGYKYRSEHDCMWLPASYRLANHSVDRPSFLAVMPIKHLRARLELGNFSVLTTYELANRFVDLPSYFFTVVANKTLEPGWSWATSPYSPPTPCSKPEGIYRATKFTMAGEQITHL